MNTVVTALNWKEDMRDLIKDLDPARWKVFQVLKIVGENDDTVAPLLITAEQFEYFCMRNHMILSSGEPPVFEDNEDMKGSYWMIDPDGNFFENTQGFLRHIPLDPENIFSSLESLPVSPLKFHARGGRWGW